MVLERISLLRHLRSATGRPEQAATPQDWLAAIAALVREHLIEQWIGGTSVLQSTSPRHVCYLSIEILPGRVIPNALRRLGLYDVCRATLGEHGLDLDEIADLEVAPALGNGGLGRLAACLLDSMANLGLPAVGYGLRYDCGMFSQHIEDGWQVEAPERWLERGHPWEIPRRALQVPVNFGGRVVEEPHEGGPRRRWIETDEVVATAYDMPIPGYLSRRLNTLRLWSARAAHELDLQSFNEGDHDRAFSRRNAIASLTQVLYPGDATPAGRELRFKQEFFFVSASVQDILRRFQRLNLPFDQLPDEVVIHINDTHPSLAIAELMRLLIDVHGLDRERAWGITRRTFAYTNHTLMPEALETWPVRFFATLLPRHLEIIYEINDRLLKAVARRRPQDDGILRRVSLVDEAGERRIRMAHLALVGARQVNGVSEIHTKLLKETVFADFDALYPGKIINVTNGVSFRHWLHEANPDLTALICSRIGDRWLSHPGDLAALVPHAEDPAFRASFRAIRSANKSRLAEVVARECGIALDVDSLFDVHIKRIHEYKRQLLKLLHVIALYDRLRRDPSATAIPRTVIFAGKAAPGYAMAKLIVKLIHDVARAVNDDPTMGGRLRLVFVPDYNVTRAQRIVPAADLSEQISTAGHEASGTGNMKLMLNGALTIGTLDGANIEIRMAAGDENFFAFGATVEEVARLRAQGYHSWARAGMDAELAGVLELIACGHFLPLRPDLFRPIVDSLIKGGDRFFVLEDFRSYLKCQERVEALYRDPEEWTRRSILNIAGAGIFSSDRTVRTYAQLIWHAALDAEADAGAGDQPAAAAE